jgi:hypothetical protein
MPFSKVEESQFEWQGDRVVHTPTGATFSWSYPNSQSEQVTVNWKNAGDVLDDGRDFDRDEVMKGAMQMLAQKRKAS